MPTPPTAAQKMAGLSVDSDPPPAPEGVNTAGSTGSFLLPTPTRTPSFQLELPEISPRLSAHTAGGGGSLSGRGVGGSSGGPNDLPMSATEGTTHTTTASSSSSSSAPSSSSTTTGSAGGATISGEVSIVEELGPKHPLHHSWVLWFDNPGPGKRVSAEKWWNNLKHVATFDTIEDFWGAINHIRPPSRLPSGSNFRLFKSGVRPMWEDPPNKQGGKWVLPVPKKGKQSVDEMWLDLLLAVVGEQTSPNPDTVCGALVHIRKQQDRLVLWTRNFNDEQGVRTVGANMKKVLNFTGTITYISHKDDASDTGPKGPRYEA